MIKFVDEFETRFKIYSMSTMSETLLSREQSQAIQISALKALLAKECERVFYRDSEIDHLLEVIRQLNTMHFGPRSERWESEEQMRLFNEVEVEASKPREEESTSTTKVGAHERKRGKRGPLPKNLERKIVEIELEVDSIKIDRSFVTDLNQLKTFLIVESIISLAGKLGSKVIAEGIETIEQLNTLTDLGSKLGQGFHFSRPLPMENLSNILSPKLVAA